MRESTPDIKDFVIESGLGTGGFAAVAMVTHEKSGQVYAVKVRRRAI